MLTNIEIPENKALRERSKKVLHDEVPFNLAIRQYTKAYDILLDFIISHPEVINSDEIKKREMRSKELGDENNTYPSSFTHYVFDANGTKWGINIHEFQEFEYHTIDFEVDEYITEDNITYYFRTMFSFDIVKQGFRLLDCTFDIADENTAVSIDNTIPSKSSPEDLLTKEPDTHALKKHMQTFLN